MERFVEGEDFRLDGRFTVVDEEGDCGADDFEEPDGFVEEGGEN